MPTGNRARNHEADQWCGPLARLPEPLLGVYSDPAGERVLVERDAPALATAYLSRWTGLLTKRTL
jgi:hypothetical protein